MNKKNILLLVLTYVFNGCGDYQSGYQDGYNQVNVKDWIIFNKEAYRQGYQVAEAERFQQDWLDENFVENDELQCRDIIVEIDPLKLLPREYKRVSADIYQINL